MTIFVSQEGKGRQNRKLAVAHHRRRRGRSEFIVAQNARGIVGRSEDSLIGVVTSNILGSKYNIWDQVSGIDELYYYSEFDYFGQKLR